MGWGEFYLRFIQWPLLSVLRYVLFFLPAVSQRFAFESKNKVEAGAQSFKLDQLKADLCFEFSSEGEFQQVASLIEDALTAGKLLELVFFSPSVEKTVMELQARYPSQIRYLRYPIRGWDFYRWVTAEHLILVRYDLFPEFLIWSCHKGHRLSFLWITFKKERVSGREVSWLKRQFLQHSSHRVFATETDFNQAREWQLSGNVYDFRIEQIRRRLSTRDEKFQRLFPAYPELKKLWERFPRSHRLILGNAWPEDLILLSSVPEDIFVLIVPHQLSSEILERMERELKYMGKNPQQVSDQIFPAPLGSTVILNKKGVLCELYADFGKAYVGGGFGQSVHSLLEPLVAGSESISCGPANHRSTEFDLAESLGRAKVVRDAQEFAEWMQQNSGSGSGHDKLKALVDLYPQYAKDVLSC